jgi:hypothetical protein
VEESFRGVFTVQMECKVKYKENHRIKAPKVIPKYSSVYG